MKLQEPPFINGLDSWEHYNNYCKILDYCVILEKRIDKLEKLVQQQLSAEGKLSTPICKDLCKDFKEGQPCAGGLRLSCGVSCDKKSEAED